jgi:hypothetical protein
MTSDTIIACNVACLTQEIDWFSQVLALRIKLYFKQETGHCHINQLAPPDLSVHGEAAYAKAVEEHQLSNEQRLIIMLALAPALAPNLLDNLFIRNAEIDRPYSEFGGIAGSTQGSFMPGVETALFILAGDDLATRIKVSTLLEADSPLLTSGIVDKKAHGQKQESEPLGDAAIVINDHYRQLFTTGQSPKLEQSSNFPAKLITTTLDWAHLVLAKKTANEVDKLVLWGKHADLIMNDWGLQKTLKPGYRALFYGPPGTGKTLTATLLGQQCDSDVYRIDLSAVVSKYIGETEKNLENLFKQAQNKNWILFFDEADALFGKRSSGSSSNDRHSNQEIAYLLQRIEDFPGMVILATNLKANVDEAFARRFQSMIFFPLPDETQRLELWQYSLNDRLQPDQADQLKDIAKRFELSGGAITNVVRYAALCAVQRGSDYIQYHDLEQGAVKELRKEGKMV